MIGHIATSQFAFIDKPKAKVQSKSQIPGLKGFLSVSVNSRETETERNPFRTSSCPATLGDRGTGAALQVQVILTSPRPKSNPNPKSQDWG